MVVPFLIIYIFNWVVFFIIFVSLIQKRLQSNLKDVKLKDNKGKKSFICQQLVIITTLSIFFGLGWGIGLFATQDIHTNKTVRDLLAALFVIITAFHGLFIFIMHCLRSKVVRNTWKQWVFNVTGKDISRFSSSTFSRKHKRRCDIGADNSGGTFLGKSIYDNNSKQKSPSSPVEVLIVENINVEIDDVNEKEKLQREKEEQNQ